MTFTEQTVNLPYGDSFISLTIGRPAEVRRRAASYFVSGMAFISYRISRQAVAFLFAVTVAVLAMTHEIREFRGLS